MAASTRPQFLMQERPDEAFSLSSLFPVSLLKGTSHGQDQTAIYSNRHGRRRPQWPLRNSSDGIVAVDLSVPKEMGGPGKPGTATPEHLFAAGYAACFGGAIDFVAKQKKKDASKAIVTCAVSIGPREGGGFGLSVKMHIEDKSMKQAELAALVKEAHEKICPYSHATRNNVDVTFDVAGGQRAAGRSQSAP